MSWCEAINWGTPADVFASSARMIKESGLKIFPFDGLDEAAAKAVECAK